MDEFLYVNMNSFVLVEKFALGTSFNKVIDAIFGLRHYKQRDRLESSSMEDRSYARIYGLFGLYTFHPLAIIAPLAAGVYTQFQRGRREMGGRDRNTL